MCALPVSASSYVKASNTKVNITSKKHGWVKKGKDYYYYNSKGKLADLWRKALLLPGKFQNGNRLAEDW